MVDSFTNAPHTSNDDMSVETLRLLFAEEDDFEIRIPATPSPKLVEFACNIELNQTMTVPATPTIDLQHQQ